MIVFRERAAKFFFFAKVLILSVSRGLRCAFAALATQLMPVIFCNTALRSVSNKTQWCRRSSRKRVQINARRAFDRERMPSNERVSRTIRESLSNRSLGIDRTKRLKYTYS